MIPLRLACVVLFGIAAVVARRLAGRKLRPTWTLRVELLRSVQRTVLDRSFVYGLPWLRRFQNRALLPRSVSRGVRFEKVDAGGVAAEWCIPTDGVTERTVLYFHGGGYVIGSLASHREIVARIALAARARVLAVDYRLGPEHPFPAAHDDCLAVTRWLLATGIDPSSLGLAGDSAGAALCLATLLALREAGEPRLGAAALLCPWVDPMADGGSIRANALFDIADRSFLVGCLERYLAGADAADQRVTPLRADLAGLPPLLIQIGSAEMLLDQARDLAARAKASGVEVELEEYVDMFHDFQVLASLLPEAPNAVAKIGVFFEKRLGSGAPSRV